MIQYNILGSFDFFCPSQASGLFQNSDEVLYKIVQYTHGHQLLTYWMSLYFVLKLCLNTLNLIVINNLNYY